MPSGMATARQPARPAKAPLYLKKAKIRMLPSTPTRKKAVLCGPVRPSPQAQVKRATHTSTGRARGIASR